MDLCDEQHDVAIYVKRLLNEDIYKKQFLYFWCDAYENKESDEQFYEDLGVHDEFDRQVVDEAITWYCF